MVTGKRGSEDACCRGWSQVEDGLIRWPVPSEPPPPPWKEEAMRVVR